MPVAEFCFAPFALLLYMQLCLFARRVAIMKAMWMLVWVSGAAWSLELRTGTGTRTGAYLRFMLRFVPVKHKTRHTDLQSGAHFIRIRNAYSKFILACMWAWVCVCGRRGGVCCVVVKASGYEYDYGYGYGYGRD